MYHSFLQVRSLRSKEERDDSTFMILKKHQYANMIQTGYGRVSRIILRSGPGGGFSQNGWRWRCCTRASREQDRLRYSYALKNVQNANIIASILDIILIIRCDTRVRGVGFPTTGGGGGSVHGASRKQDRSGGGIRHCGAGEPGEGSGEGSALLEYSFLSSRFPHIVDPQRVYIGEWND